MFPPKKWRNLLFFVPFRVCRAYYNRNRAGRRAIRVRCVNPLQNVGTVNSSDSSNPTDPRSTEQFVELLGRHERQLGAYVLTLVADWNDAHDILQEVRIRLWQQFDQYDAAGDFGAWARSIAYYQVRTQKARGARQRLQFSEEVMDLLADEASMLSHHVDDRQAALSACLEKLNSEQRELLTCCYQGDMTPRQVAKQQGRGYEAVRKSLLRVRHTLRECIEQNMKSDST